MRDMLQRFMAGRYGVDRLSRFFLVVSIISLLVSFPFGGVVARILYVFALVLLLTCYFRMLSKNYEKRYKENMKYEDIRFRIVVFFKKIVRRFQIKKTHKIFKCPVCGQQIKIPKGHGKIEVDCPKCRNKFIRKS